MLQYHGNQLPGSDVIAKKRYNTGGEMHNNPLSDKSVVEFLSENLVVEFLYENSLFLSDKPFQKLLVAEFLSVPKGR